MLKIYNTQLNTFEIINVQRESILCGPPDIYIWTRSFNRTTKLKFSNISKSRYLKKNGI